MNNSNPTTNTNDGHSNGQSNRSGNKPELTNRDGSLKCTVWRNQGEKGEYYTTTIARTYTDEYGKPRDTHNLSQTDLLRGSKLMEETYGMINEHKRQLAHDKIQTRNVDQDQKHTQAYEQADMLPAGFESAQQTPSAQATSQTQTVAQQQDRQTFKDQRRQSNGQDQQKDISF